MLEAGTASPPSTQSRAVPRGCVNAPKPRARQRNGVARANRCVDAPNFVAGGVTARARADGGVKVWNGVSTATAFTKSFSLRTSQPFGKRLDRNQFIYYSPFQEL